jgi:cysteinyl-tRNA synthetase
MSCFLNIFHSYPRVIQECVGSMLKLYNDLVKNKEEFKPIRDGQVKIYVCGPTVYDSPHIGHARSAIAFDILRRYLIFKGNKVTYVSNYTDVDDKMIDRANDRNITIKELAVQYIKEYEDVMKELNILNPDIRPRATETIPAIQELTKILIDKGFGYESHGSVYFEVDKLEGYDNIFMRKVKKKEDGDEYVQTSPDQDTLTSNEFIDEKKGEKDFALWKAAKENEPKWDSPWGEGRPGWHIECSAMVKQYLGSEIDIHGGGKDLIFPHHTNEIAQTKAAYGTMLARYWIHNGFVTNKGEKMSKSLKNFFSAAEVLKEYSGMIVRFFLSSVNYRSPINYSIEGLDEAKNLFQKLQNFYRMVYSLPTNDKVDPKEEKQILGEIEKNEKAFYDAMDDDLNSTDALSALYQFIKVVNTKIIEQKKEITESLKKRILTFMNDFSQIFGVVLDDTQLHSNLPLLGSSNTELDKLIEEKQKTVSDLVNLIITIRTELRKKKVYDLSDQIRKELAKIGIILDDQTGRTLWKFTTEE